MKMFDFKKVYTLNTTIDTVITEIKRITFFSLLTKFNQKHFFFRVRGKLGYYSPIGTVYVYIKPKIYSDKIILKCIIFPPLLFWVFTLIFTYYIIVYRLMCRVDFTQINMTLIGTLSYIILIGLPLIILFAEFCTHIKVCDRKIDNCLRKYSPKLQ